MKTKDTIIDQAKLTLTVNNILGFEVGGKVLIGGSTFWIKMIVDSKTVELMPEPFQRERMAWHWKAIAVVATIITYLIFML